MTALVLAALVAGTVPAPAGGGARAEAPIVASVRLEARSRGRGAARALHRGQARRAPRRRGRPAHRRAALRDGRVRGRGGGDEPRRVGGVDVVFRPGQGAAAERGARGGRRGAQGGRRCAGRRACARASRSGRPASSRRRASSRLSLAQRGYLEARVTAAARPAADGADAVFTIASGPLVRVGDARVEGPRGGDVASLQRRRSGRGPGEPFRRERAQASVAAAARSARRPGLLEGRRHRGRGLRPDGRGHEPRLPRRARPAPRRRGARRGLRPPARPHPRPAEGRRRSSRTRSRRRATSSKRTPARRGHRAGAGDASRGAARADSSSSCTRWSRGRWRASASVRVEGDDTEGLDAARPAPPGRAAPRRGGRAGSARAHAGPRGARPSRRARGGGGAGRRRRPARGLPRHCRARARGVLAGRWRARRRCPRRARPRSCACARVARTGWRDLARDRDTVLAAYRNGGYLQAEVTPEVTFSEDRAAAAVVLRVAPGAPTTVDHVVVAGLERTKETVVRRELAVKEGEPLGPRPRARVAAPPGGPRALQPRDASPRWTRTRRCGAAWSCARKRRPSPPSPTASATPSRTCCAAAWR